MEFNLTVVLKDVSLLFPKHQIHGNTHLRNTSSLPSCTKTTQKLSPISKLGSRKKKVKFVIKEQKRLLLSPWPWSQTYQWFLFLVYSMVIKPEGRGG